MLYRNGEYMKILAIGDVVSSQGCEYLMKTLPALKREFGIDLTIVNGENSATGNGMHPKSADFLLNCGADVITGGNHTLKRREIYEYLDSSKPVIRPANLYRTAPGRGYEIIDMLKYKVGIINLIGVVYMDNNENPFDCAQRLVKELKEKGCKIIIVDFHAEATGEKRALGYFLDGEVSAVFGTHTHVQTADEQILPNSTGYITDIGMTGPVHSVLGVKVELAIEKTKTNLPVRFETPDGECRLEGCIFEIDEKTGKTINITRIRR